MSSPRMTRAAILAQLDDARARSARSRRAGHRAIAARFDRRRGRIVLELSHGYLFGFPVKRIPALARASTAQLAAVEVSPGGGALRWEALDVDLSVPGLLLDAVGRTERLQELGRLAGKATSPAKSAAARRNGAKGGRPRTVRVA